MIVDDYDDWIDAYDYGDPYDYDDAYDPDECEREELDEARGICRECDTWGEIQCRRHGDIVLEAMAAEARSYWLGVYARRGKHTKASRKARFRLNAMRGAP